MPTPLDNYLDQDYLKKNYLGRTIKAHNDLYKVTENGLVSQGALPSGKTQDYYNSLKLLEFSPFESANRMGGLYDTTLTADNTNTFGQVYQAFKSDYKSTLPQSIQNVIGFAPGSVAGQTYIGAPELKGFNPSLPVQQGAMPTGYNGVTTNPTFNTASAGSATDAPQVAQPGGQAPYFYGADVLGKKANDAAVNTLYKAYFGRDASAAELKNWGASGGADTTVKSLEDFLKSEQIKYKVPQGTSLTPESFKPTTATTLPAGNLADNANNADAVVASTPAITKSFQDYVDERTLALTDNQKKEQGLEDMMASLTGQSTRRGADQLAAEQTAGISTLKENVNNIISQIEAKKLEYEAYKQAQQGKPITMSSITGSIAQKQSQIASDILLLQAQGMMYQGKLDTAQATVDRALDLKYQTLDNQYKIYASQLDALRPTLTREENIRADAMQAMMADRQQALADQKAKEKTAQNAKLDKIDMENKLAQAGYVKINSPAQLAGLDESQITRLKDNNGKEMIFKNPPEKVKAGGGGGGTDPNKVLSIADAKSLGVPYGTTVGQAMTMGITPGAIENASISSYQNERITRNLESVNQLSIKAAQNPSIFGKSAALPLPDFLRSDAYRNFKSELDTLKANITFGELTAMREASKTGGALGQVSDRENQLLGAALGALNMSQSPQNFKEQLNKINASITRWKNAAQSAQTTNKLVTAPDGQVIEIVGE